MSSGEPRFKIDPWSIPGNVALRIFFFVCLLLINDAVYGWISGAFLKRTIQNFSVQASRLLMYLVSSLET